MSSADVSTLSKEGSSCLIYHISLVDDLSTTVMKHKKRYTYNIFIFVIFFYIIINKFVI